MQALQSLADFLASFGETVVVLTEYVFGLISDIVNMVVLLGMAAVKIPEVLSFLPGPIVAVLITFLTGAILYKVLGREG